MRRHRLRHHTSPSPQPHPTMSRVASVQFKVGTTNIGAAITLPPYTTAWDSTGVTDGTYTLYAVAKDTSGNYATIERECDGK